MCEQCEAEMTWYSAPGTSNNEVFPGWGLGCATKDGFRMKKDQWGLVRTNDPDFVWTATPVADREEEEDAFWDAAANLEEGMRGAQPDAIVQLYESCKQVGYTLDNGRLAWWLCNYLAVFLETAVAHPPQSILSNYMTSEHPFEKLLAKYNLKPQISSRVGVGWHELLDHLFSQLQALGWDGEVAQVKEKFGTLRVHLTKITPAVAKLVSEAERKSMTICEDCGAPGTRQGSGWVRTLCLSCTEAWSRRNKRLNGEEQ